MVRARLTCTEWSESAFRSSPGSTGLGITACMAGANSALAVPATIEIAMMCNTAMCPLAVSTARVSAVAAITPCFFHAEVGIRDYKVTGVQTCALPICAMQQALGRGLNELDAGMSRVQAMRSFA